MKERESDWPPKKKQLSKSTDLLGLTEKKLDEGLKQAILASKNDIAESIEKEIFWWKTKKKNIHRVNSNKTRHVKIKKKLNDHITSYTNIINDLSKEVKLTSMKVFNKKTMNGYGIPNETKYFFRRWITNLFSVSTIS